MARSAADSHGSGPSPTRARRRARHPELAGGQRRADRPGVEHGAATLTPWLMPESTRSGSGPTAPTTPAMTERAGEASARRPLPPRHPRRRPAGRGLSWNRSLSRRRRRRRCSWSWAPPRIFVGRVAARPVGPGRQGPRERRQSGGAHPVVVGDENPHVRSPYRPSSRAPGPVHPPFGSVSPGGHTRPLGPPHPRRGPGLLQFTRNAGRLAQDLRRLAHRAAVAHRARPPGGHRLRGRRHAAGLQRRPDRGPRRLRRRRVVPLGPGQVLAPGPIAWPTAATSTTGCSRRPRWTSRSATTPFTASCAGCPGRSRPGTRTSSPSACNSIPRPATRSPSSWSGVPRGPRGPERHDAGAIAGAGPDPLRPRLPPLPGRRDRDGRRGDPARAGRHTLETDERGLPTGARTPVEGTERDFTTARFVGPVVLDTAFTTLERDADGVARATLDLPGGVGGAALWVDTAFPYLMVYTGDTLGECSGAGTPSPLSR